MIRTSDAHAQKREQVLFPRIQQLGQSAQSREALPDGYPDFFPMLRVKCFGNCRESAAAMWFRMMPASAHPPGEYNILFPSALAFGKRHGVMTRDSRFNRLRISNPEWDSRSRH